MGQRSHGNPRKRQRQRWKTYRKAECDNYCFVITIEVQKQQLRAIQTKMTKIIIKLSSI